MGKRQAKRGSALDSVLLGTLGLGNHVNVTWTRTTYVKMVADHVHQFMDNALCHTAKIVQKWFEEHESVQGVYMASKFPRFQSD